ncbi:unnamed protein product [Caenorhabditis angaria]|uniref:Uncharacterized protein n=1 Tax=Caenorhabditis angaria TaxID=860376 RepID=A0A9P1IU68_9PELO|nr:unnamed protein product [Caenorhabditis angaria]
MHLSVLFLCISQIFFTNATKFWINQKFTCKLQKHWELSVRYYEWDLTTDNEDVFEIRRTKVHNKMAIVKTGFVYSEGDGVGDNYYEMKMYLTHTCTDTGKQSFIDYKLGDFPVDDREASIEGTYQLDTYCRADICS